MNQGIEARRERRDEVFHRTRIAAADGAYSQAVLVNLSPGGAMIRCDRPFAEGERLRVQMPVHGEAEAEVRWALGGRIGCRFVHDFSATDYAEMLDATRRE